MACHAATNGWRNAAFMAAGMVCIAVGLVNRLLMQRQGQWSFLLRRPLANLSVSMGLALTTGRYFTPVIVRNVDHCGCVCRTAPTSGRAR